MEERGQGEKTGHGSCGIFRARKEWRMKRESQASEECMASPTWGGAEGMSKSPVVLKGQLGRSPWTAAQHGPRLSSSSPQRRRAVNRRGD